MTGFNELVGKTIIAVRQDTDELIFLCHDDSQYRMFHSQDCCESVTIHEIVPDFKGIIGSEVLVAEVVTSDENPPEYVNDCWQWTFYKIVTTLGYVTISWFGESNCYYSIDVDFERIA